MNKDFKSTFPRGAILPQSVLTALLLLSAACGQASYEDAHAKLSRQKETTLRARAGKGDWRAAKDLSIYWNMELGRADAETLRVTKQWADNDVHALPILSDLLLSSCDEKDRSDGVKAYRTFLASADFENQSDDARVSMANELRRLESGSNAPANCVDFSDTTK
ncbi:MAG: hypothetical protein IV086_18590 [Hyphomonadaceae bacterium]|nr:hypothetical protein [Hyphomonadaceae bacterium]